MLRTAAFTQSSLYPHMLLHREVCAQRNFTHRRIYTERFYAKRLLHSEARSSAEPALLPFELLCIFLLPLPDLSCSPSQVRCIIPGLQHHTGARIHRALQEAVCHTMLSYPGNPWHHLSHLFPWFFLLCDILRFTSASKYPVKFLSTAAAFLLKQFF